MTKSSNKAYIKKLIVEVTAVVLIAAVTLFVGSCGKKEQLVLSDDKTGEVFAKYEFTQDDVFSVSFIHSVNQSEVIDYFQRGENGELLCFATKFHAFGAGMPTEWPEYAVVETSADGIYVSNLDIRLPEVRYIVATVSDHILEIGGQKISLGELCGKNAHVVFSLK